LPSNPVQIVERFTYAGQFALMQLLAVGVVFALFIVALSVWEARAIRQWLPALLAPLRVAAAAIVLWMLAEPSICTVIRHTRAKSIVLMADASASMGVVDPSQEQTQTVRWTAVDEDTNSTPAAVMREIDGAAFTLSAGRESFAGFVAAAEREGPIESARAEVAVAHRKIEAAEAILRRLSSQPETAAVFERGSIDGVLSALRGFVLPGLDELVEDLDRGRFTAEARGGRLSEVRTALDQATARLVAVSETLAARISEGADAATRNDLQRQLTQSRRDRAAGLLDCLERSSIKVIAPAAEVLRYGFDRDAFPVSGPDWSEVRSPKRPEAEQGTDLTAALGQIERDTVMRSIRAVVWLTDGAHNAAGDPVKRASAIAGTPIYIVPIGSVKPVRDVMLHHVRAPRSVFQNDLIVIEAIADALECDGESLTIRLLREGRVLEEQTLAVTSDTFSAPVTFKPKADPLGVMKLELRVEPLGEEAVRENNRVELDVEVTEAKIRVLLADESPRWEFRYLRNLFKRDDRVEFSSLLFEPAAIETARMDPVAALPDDLDGWSRFRVVVLGDVTPATLTLKHQQHLRDYVALRGGTLVLIAGEAAMPGAYRAGPLGPMLPVEPAKSPAFNDEGFRIVVTPEGRATEATQLEDDPVASDRLWGDIPLRSLSDYSRPRQTSRVLLAAVPRSANMQGATDSFAFLCWQRYGKGRVVYLAAPATYRLRYRYGDRHHHRFWGQLLRWAIAREIGTGSNTVRLVTDKMRYQEGDPVQFTVRLQHPNGEPVAGAGIDVLAARGTQTVATVATSEDRDSPGVYHATLKDLPVGGITLSVTGAAVQALLNEEGYAATVKAEIALEPPLSPELRNTRCNLPLLTRIAAVTGGAVLPPTALPTALSMLDLSPDVSEEVSQVSLWPRWRYLALFFACLTVEWVARKVVGLA
jgi:hypothetical protein